VDKSEAGRAAAAPAPAQSVPERTASDSAAELADAQKRVQQHVQHFIAEHDQEARFSVDHATGMTIVQIVKRSSGELVRQIPTEEVVRIAQFLDAQSAFVNVKA
jgi:flagellar protein FlaG